MCKVLAIPLTASLQNFIHHIFISYIFKTLTVCHAKMSGSQPIQQVILTPSVSIYIHCLAVNCSQLSSHIKRPTWQAVAKVVPNLNLDDMLAGNTEGICRSSLIIRRHLDVAPTIMAVVNCLKLETSSGMSLAFWEKEDSLTTNFSGV